MRPSTDLRPPGVFAALADPVAAPLQIADTRTAGFVGLAERGPIDEPRRISSWDEFVATYGRDEHHFLTDSVDAYFRNGGVACYVVRVAHVARGDAEPDTTHAVAAAKVALDDWKKPALRISANSEGSWGNSIWVSVHHRTGARSLLTQDLEVGEGAAHVNSTRGFEVGQLVRIFDRDGSDYVVISRVEERLLRWEAATPVNRRHRAASPTHLEVLEFELRAALRDRREVFKGLQIHPTSSRYAPRVIAAESRLIQVEDLGTSSPPPHNLVAPSAPVRLSGGRDGAEAITPEDFVGHDHGPADRAGLKALVAVDEVATLACPDAMLFVERAPGPEGELKARRVQDAMVDLCENLRDRFAVLDCPQTRSIENVMRWRRRTDSSYCAYYWPWIGVPARQGAIRRIPPSGLMAGIFALVDTVHGVHQAPANVPVLGAVELGVRVTEDDLGFLNSEGINSFRIARGIRPWGGRTASSDPDWRYVSVRRLFIMLRRSLEAGMSWVPFEPNDQATWESVRDQVEVFLTDLFKLGMFAEGKPEDCFFVRCGEDTNPPEAVAEGKLTCEVGVAPSIPAEFITISIVQRTGPGG